MKLETELKLSYYRQLSDLAPRHAVKLVRHTETGRVYVMKTQKIYDLRVYRYLRDHPIPGVPRIEELIEDEDALYVVEEYISGETLRERLDRTGPVGEEQAEDYIRQLCRILRPLHRLEPPIVHRDVKPENLIVTDDGRLVLIDFNTAKESREEQERDTVLIGTAGYAAPEQYGFSVSRPTADIYAIGVLYHELLTGRLPGREPYPGPMGAVIGRCLCMDPKQRCQSVSQLLEAMDAVRKPPLREKIRAKMSWLPPGFRTCNPYHMVVMSLWYAFVFWISANLEVGDYSPGAPILTGARIMVFAIFIGDTLWCGNYRGVWSRMPLSSSRNLLVRLLGVAFWAVTLFWTAFAAGVIVLSALFE